jgi:hypothetical protein
MCTNCLASTPRRPPRWPSASWRGTARRSTGRTRTCRS